MVVFVIDSNLLLSIVVSFMLDFTHVDILCVGATPTIMVPSYTIHNQWKFVTWNWANLWDNKLIIKPQNFIGTCEIFYNYDILQASLCFRKKSRNSSHKEIRDRQTHVHYVQAVHNCTQLKLIQPIVHILHSITKSISIKSVQLSYGRSIWHWQKMTSGVGVG